MENEKIDEEKRVKHLKELDARIEKYEKKYGKPSLTKEEIEKIEDQINTAIHYKKYQRHNDAQNQNEQEFKPDNRPFYEKHPVLFWSIVCLLVGGLSKTFLLKYKEKRADQLMVEKYEKDQNKLPIKEK